MMTGNEPSVVLVRRIRASANEVYDALIVPDLMSRWMRPGPDWAIAVDTDPRPGGVYSIVSIDGAGVAHTSGGKYRELSPGRRLFMTWVYAGAITALAGVETLVAVDLRSVEPDVTQLTMTHSRLTADFERDHYRDSWTNGFDRMEAMFADSGRD